MNWKEYFDNLSQVIKTKSNDTNYQVGAIIVDKDNSIVSTGYNGFPRGVPDDKPDRHEKPEKYFWFEHAERNAIYNAAKMGSSTDGCTMYITSPIPCADCTRAIINAGIKKVVCHDNIERYNAKWTEHAKRSFEMLKLSGVEVEYF